MLVNSTSCYPFQKWITNIFLFRKRDTNIFYQMCCTLWQITQTRSHQLPLMRILVGKQGTQPHRLQNLLISAPSWVSTYHAYKIFSA